MVTVITGANEQELPLGGRTVGFARQQLAPIFNIAGDAVPTVNGLSATNDTVLSDGDELQFARAAAEKGR